MKIRSSSLEMALLAGIAFAASAASAHPLFPLELGRVWGWDDATVTQVVAVTDDNGAREVDVVEPFGLDSEATLREDLSGNVLIKKLSHPDLTATISPPQAWLPASANPGATWSGTASAQVSGTYNGNFDVRLDGEHLGVYDYASPWGGLRVERVAMKVYLETLPTLWVEAIEIQIEYAEGIGPVRRSVDGGETWDAVVAIGAGFTPLESTSVGALKSQFD